MSRTLGAWLTTAAKALLPPVVLTAGRRTVSYGRRQNPRRPIVKPVDEERAQSVIRNVLFICGLHRSGTTLIEEYVRSAFDVSVLRAEVPENEGQHLQDVYPPAYLHGGPGRFAFSAEMHPRPGPPSVAESDARRIKACWAGHIDGESTYLCEKSPPNLTKIAWLRARFPGATFLIVVRDPRAVAAATQKWTRTTLEELVFHWHVAYSSAARAMGDDCVVVAYEDFCDDPFGALTDSGLPDRIPLRPDRLAVLPRFANVKNSNEAYLSQFDDRVLGEGIWKDYGYEL